MDIAAIIFDFDGVILDSVGVKTSAFAKLVEAHGAEAVRRMVEYHEANGGISRYKKFAWFSRTVLGRELTEEESLAWGRKFESDAFCRVVEAPFIAGAREFLEGCDLPLFVASGTPETELRSLVEKRGLAGLFREVHGSPRTKQEIIQDILGRYPLSLEEVLFVGDAMTDYRAARDCGLPFAGVAADARGPFPPGTPVVTDLTGLTVLLGSFTRG